MGLKDSEEFKNVYLKSSKSHAERLIELNARAILRELPQGWSLRVDSNGRIKPRIVNDNRAEASDINAYDHPRSNETIKIAQIIVCGWTKDNHDLRSSLIKCVNAYITCICETHIPGQNKIEIDGYTWYGHNRTEIHRNAPTASGGIGILVKESVTKLFDTEIFDKSCDGVLGLNLPVNTQTITLSCFLITCPLRGQTGDETHKVFSRIF